MSQQDGALHFRITVVNLRDTFRQGKTRNRVGHIGHAIAEYVARDRLALRLIGDRKHRGRMGVIDKFMRQESVQQCFDRRIRCGGIQQIDALVIDHVLVREFREIPEAP